MKRFVRLIIIHIILILILVGLMIKIKSQEDNFNCEACQAKFSSYIGFDENIKEVIFYENLTRMYEHYSKEKCSVRFDDSGGYMGALINITIFKDG